MRTLLYGLCVITLVLAGSNSASAQEKKDPLAEWETFGSKEGRFKVKFPPGKIEEKTMDVPVGTEKLKLYLIGYENEKTAYLASYCDYPKDLVENADLDDMLDNVIKGMLQGMNGKEKSTDKIKMEGFNARELAFTLPELNATGKARAVIVKNRLYQLIAFDTNAKKGEDIDAFLGTFKLVKEKKEKK